MNRNKQHSLFTSDTKVYDLRNLGNSANVMDLIRKLVLDPAIDKDPFFVADLDEIYMRHVRWLELFPRIEPLYAVKSNYDCFVLKLLAYLGVGFDCSSKGEIETLMMNGICPGRILFANPNKQISHLAYSKKVGVNKMVFDSEYELLKIKHYHPNAECILRIRVESLSAKFGADRPTSTFLIRRCIELGVNLTGVSFYVGFRQKTPENIIESIRNARHLFDYARDNFCYIMHVVDIGGGFPGTWQTKGLFEQMSKQINSSLDEFFPHALFSQICEAAQKQFKVIAELGTYYTCSAYTLCVNVISKKELALSDQDRHKLEKEADSITFINGAPNSLATDKRSVDYRVCTNKKLIYFINDSLHASFKWYDVSEGLPIFAKPVAAASHDATVPPPPFYLASIGGATCDTSDFILKDCFMPELDIEDFLIFRNMGSYTKTAASYFNDIPLPETIFVSTKLWDIVKNCIHCTYSQDHYTTSILNSKLINQSPNSYKNAIEKLVCK